MSEHVSEHVDEGHRRLTLVKSVRWFYQSERLKDESQKRFHFVDSAVIVLRVYTCSVFRNRRVKEYMLLKTCFVQT